MLCVEFSSAQLRQKFVRLINYLHFTFVYCYILQFCLIFQPTNHLDIESVEALIDALKVFEGGVILVSHDARLITATDCELWVCGDSPNGLRVEGRGFEKYRSDVMAETRKLQVTAERKAAARVLLRRSKREDKAALLVRNKQKTKIVSVFR